MEVEEAIRRLERLVETNGPASAKETIGLVVVALKGLKKSQENRRNPTDSTE